MGAGGRSSSKSDGPARRAQAQWRRQRLLDAALATFVDKGVDGAAVKDITAAAGVTQGLLYHYFDGKDALVLAILQERGFLPELRRLLAGPRGRPAGAVLPELAAGFRRLLAEHAELVALFFAASRADPAVRAGLHGFVAEGQQLLADYLAARVAAGELRPTTWRGRWSPASPDDRPGHESSGRVAVVTSPAARSLHANALVTRTEAPPMAGVLGSPPPRARRRPRLVAGRPVCSALGGNSLDVGWIPALWGGERI
jgi:TetR/AcrR family transcriptional regulator, cholesterol catabolism regulator